MIEIERLRNAVESTGDGTGNHVEDRLWEALALDELGPDERNEILDHVLECPECRDIHRAILSLREEAHTFDPGAPKPAPGPASPFRRRITPALLAMAATVLFLVVFPRFWTGPEHFGVTLRGSTRESAPVPIAPAGPTAADSIVFSWKPATPPASVELLDAGGDIIWTGPESDSGRTPWPMEIEPKPGIYYWRALPAGDGRPPSELIRFEITAPG